MSNVIPLLDDEGSDTGALDRAANVLEKGSVVVMPVGGVYAVLADAFRTAATQRIFAARRRSRVTPLPVLIRSERQVSGLVRDIPEYADRLMASYWPGDVTLILPSSDGMTWDLGNDKGTVQLRRPTEDVLLRLIGRVGPLACTAANRLSQPWPTTAEDAKRQLGVLVPLYVDGGETDGRASTIVDCTGPSANVVREGAVSELHVLLVAEGQLPWGERPDTAEPEGPAPSEVDGEAEVEEEPASEETEDGAVEDGDAVDGQPVADEPDDDHADDDER